MKNEEKQKLNKNAKERNAFDNCLQIIRTIYPDITEPCSLNDGDKDKNKVLYADGRVFKIEPYALAYKNENVSRVYEKRNIPVPKAKAIVSSAYLAVEEYPFVPGENLHTAIKHGIGAKQIQEIYRDVVKYFAAMDKVYPSQLNQMPINKIHNIAHTVTLVNDGPTMANIVRGYVYMANLGSNKDCAVYHTAISPKNIIVSPKGKFITFVDLDEVGVANRNYAFAAMASRYKEIGMNVDDLFRIYHQVGDFDLNHGRIMALMNMHALGQKALWKTRQKTK